MKSARRIVASALAVVIGLSLTLVATVPAAATTVRSAQVDAATWELYKLQQRPCYSAASGHPSTYLLATVIGTWSKTITIGVRNLPPGTTSSGGSRIAPGTNEPRDDGSITINGFIQLSVAPTPVGEYAAEIWASDGVETQTVPVTLVFKESCY